MKMERMRIKLYIFISQYMEEEERRLSESLSNQIGF